MDAFEQIIAALFEEEGYWVLRNYRVNLTPEQKRELDNPSMPRPEIDIVAYKPGDNELLFIECKSYLDSGGVRLSAIQPGGSIKLFADGRYRQKVTEEFLKQAVTKGLLKEQPSVNYCLVAGNVYSQDREKLEIYFEEQGWLLYGKKWIEDSLKSMANIDYKNNIAVIMAKLLLRSKEAHANQT